MVKIKKPDNLLERLVPILLFASIALAFVVGVLWQKVNSLEGGGVAGTKTVAEGNADADAQPQPQQGPAQGKLSDEQVEKIPAVTDDDHVRGNRDAKVFLIEYSDYECPFCARFHSTAQQVLDEYGDRVAWVYRHFPLDQLHSKARPAAEAAECVADIGGNDAFWKFTDALLEDSSALGDLVGAASNIGVNISDCVESGKFKDRVDGQYQAGVQAGVRGTPGNFVVNDKGEAWFMPGAYPFEQIKTAIDEALN